RRNEQGYPLEQSSKEKAAQYRRHWQAHILPHKGNNLGGVAFCWRDRLEGTATWFGLTDIENGLKPGYFALKSLWTGSETLVETFDVFIVPPYYVDQRKSSYIFRLHSPALHDPRIADKLNILWYACEDGYLRHLSGLKVEEGAWACRVTYSAYGLDVRVYVRVETPSGVVMTASEPVFTPSGGKQYGAGDNVRPHTFLTSPPILGSW
ncbi:MAG: hypothetical protein AAFV07_04890, partial [Bacteroidota bacterium]